MSSSSRPKAPVQRMVPLRTHAGGGEMAVLDFGDPKRPVDVIFVHANGFNGRTYKSILLPLSRELRILAPDLRGHGSTTLPIDGKGDKSWRILRDDLLGLIEALDLPPVVLAGHSMGGTVSILAAGKGRERVRGLALFDPVMWGQVGVLMAHLPWAQAMAAKRAPIAVQAARRRSVFDSRPAAFKAYHDRGAFKGWPDAMLRDYVAAGFRDRADGKVELTCPPDWEARLYTTHAHDPYGALRRFGGPVSIWKARRGSTCRVKDVAAFERQFPGARVEKVEGGHFFPMTSPDVVRDGLRHAAARTSPCA